MRPETYSTPSGIAVTREYLKGLAFSAKGFKLSKGALQ